MRKIDWNNVQEAQEFTRVEPGGYVAVICRVEDNEDKEYLRVEWDFADGPYYGANGDTWKRVGFWPTPLIRSYKETALPFFKAFKTALEESNPGYQFREDDLQAMRGQVIGVILREEEYRAKDGNIKTRISCDSVRSVEAIRNGDFEVPALKKLKTGDSANAPASSSGFTPLGDETPLSF